MDNLLSQLETHCPAPIFTGNRIARQSEKELGRFRLDAETLYELGNDNVAILVGGQSTTSAWLEKLERLSQAKTSGRVVVAAATKGLADWCFSVLYQGRKRKRPPCFDVGCLTVTTVEGLKKVQVTEEDPRPILAVLVWDPKCFVHKARGEEGYGWTHHDRPQMVAQCRQQNAIGDWSPPLVLLTDKPPKSLAPSTLSIPYSVEAWWFVQGPSMRFPGKIQQEQGENESSCGKQLC